MSLTCRGIKSPVWLAVTLTCFVIVTGNSADRGEEHLITVGWVQAAGEIHIYAHRSDLGRLYDGTCLTGVMTDGRTMPAEFQNRRVSVYGTLVDAKEFSDMTVRGVSTGVENYCGSAKIAIITRLVPVASAK
jgi:hypothetical protein